MKITEIGISDILQHRACPSRFALGMRRHETGRDVPESWSPENAYGSAVHEGIHVWNETGDLDLAVRSAFQKFSAWLEPDDLAALREDLEVYIERDPGVGYRTVVAEEDIRFPLVVHNGVQIYFRAKIDRLMVREDDDTSFLSIDYKTSKWARSQDEVHEDIQQWSYNVAVHEVFPECEDLDQIYDQLRHGALHTHKTPEQRQRMKDWLAECAIAIVEDDDLLPQFNQFCAWCPLKMDCSVVREELTDFALAKIAALAPREPKVKKDGSPSKVLRPPLLDAARFSEYTEVLPDVKAAKNVLEAYINEVNTGLKAMTAERREGFGFRIREKKKRAVPPSGLRILADELGPTFYHLVSVSLAGAERFFGGKKDPRYQRVVELTEEQPPIYEVVPVGD